MRDPRVDNLAKILVHYSINTKPDDWVLVNANVLALPLVKSVVQQILAAGGKPSVILESDELLDITLAEASEAQLGWLSPLDQIAYEQADGLITLRATSNTRALTGVDPTRQRLRQNARRPLIEAQMRRAAQGSLRWVLAQFPCPAYAQDAEMSLAEYEDFVYSATFADQPDPVKCWQDLHDEQHRLVEWLKGKRQVIVRGPDCDLKLSIEGRTFMNSDGRNNMPSGEIFTGPVEDSVNGWIRFTYPAIFNGREVEGVEMEFRKGKVIKARARKNETYLTTMLDSDDGARFLGEFAVGTNYGIRRFTKSILFDEKIGGSIHLAVGAGYPQTGSRNQSSIHWDFICDMRYQSEIRVDDELFYKNGEFQV